ncbi:hypothetical protein IT418_02325 [bacterium]|nr:hypothetical protein [bacterium]
METNTIQQIPVTEPVIQSDSPKKMDFLDLVKKNKLATILAVILVVLVIVKVTTNGTSSDKNRMRDVGPGPINTEEQSRGNENDNGQPQNGQQPLNRDEPGSQEANAQGQFPIECKPQDQNQWYRTDDTFLVDHKNPNIMYVNVEWKGFYKTTDGGKTWSRKVAGIFTDHIDITTRENCYSEFPTAIMDPNNSNRILLATAGSPGTLKDMNSRGGGIYETTDGGEHWTQKINDTMNVYTTEGALAFKPGDPNTYYYGTSAAPASYQEADQNKLFVTKGIIYKTTDNGKAWSELPTGFTKNARLSGIIIDTKNTNKITATTVVLARNSGGPNAVVPEQMGVIQSLDGGESWKRIGNLPKGYQGTYGTEYSHKNPDHIFTIAATQGGTPSKSFYSTDGGLTWKESEMAMDLVAYDPFDTQGNKLLGYKWQGCSGPCVYALYESTDAGKSWKTTKGTLPKEIKNIMDVKTRIYNIVWHPTDQNTLYVTGSYGYVWKSVDHGKTWVTLLSVDSLE